LREGEEFRSFDLPGGITADNDFENRGVDYDRRKDLERTAYHSDSHMGYESFSNRFMKLDVPETEMWYLFTIGSNWLMTRYKVMVIFDVHEDENRERRDQLAKRFLKKKQGKATIWPTLKQQYELNDLMHDHLTDEFVHEISERMNNKKNKYRTTYEIISFDKIGEE
jgi:hypothetical protein